MSPFWILNLFNNNNNTAFIIYITSMLLIFSTVVHKYTHEANHNRYVPYCIKLLQQFNILLKPTKHKMHHENIIDDYAVLNGLSDNYANLFIDTLDKILGTKSYEEIIDLCNEYKSKYGDIITLKFTDDIEGEIKVKLNRNIIELA